MGKLTDKVAKGVFWVLMEKFGIHIVHFVVTLILARLLTPNDYGTVALLSIFISLSNLLVDCGFGKALVQKKEATQTDFNSVFYLSMAIAAVLYTVLFFASPLVARFYGVPELKTMLRILALSLIFHSINGVQNVELNRKMLFKLSFKISWARSIASAITGISFALAGYGPWALVFSSLSGGVIGVIARQLVIRWRPTCTFSWASISGLFRFGWKMAVAGLFNESCNKLIGLAIGKVYSRSDLAFLNRGKHTPKMLTELISGTFRRVAFSALARMQDQRARMRGALRRAIKCSTFCVFPLMAACAIFSEPLVIVLFGEQWRPCVPYMRLYCLAFAFGPFNTINFQAIAALGRSDAYLKLIIFRRVLWLGMIVFSLRLGILAYLICSVLFAVVVGMVVNSWPNRKLLNYTIGMQLRDVFPAMAMSLATGGIVCGIFMVWPWRVEFFMVPGVLLFFAVYVSLALFFRSQSLDELSRIARGPIVRRLPFTAAFFDVVARRCGK